MNAPEELLREVLGESAVTKIKLVRAPRRALTSR
jgi:hypothetical protein